MPQPSACPASVPKEDKENMERDLGKAVKSIPAYVIFSILFCFISPVPHLFANQHLRTGT